MNHRRKIHLADALSLLRVICTVFVVSFSLAGMWRVAFALLVIGWTTDLLDGLAARKFGSYQQTHPDFDADGLADTALAFCSSLVPVAYAIQHTGWLSPASIILMVVFAITVVSGIWMVLIMNGPKTALNRKVIAINMIVMHGGVQIGGVILWFAYMAFGLGSMTGVTAGAVLGLIIVQWNKLQLWWKGSLTAA